MKKEHIQHLFQQFEKARYIYNTIECWSARELQNLGIWSRREVAKVAILKLKCLNKQNNELLLDTNNNSNHSST